LSLVYSCFNTLYYISEKFGFRGCDIYTYILWIYVDLKILQERGGVRLVGAFGEVWGCELVGWGLGGLEGYIVERRVEVMSQEGRRRGGGI
jgi:hypothetical protein